MDAPNPPPVPPPQYTPFPMPSAQPPRKSWWGRNWKWFVPVVIGIPFLCLCSCGGLVVFVFSTIKNSDVAKSVVRVAGEDSRVTTLIGTPVKQGWWGGAGGISVDASGGGHASLMIPITGPKGDGIVQAEADRNNKMWTFTKFIVHIGQQNIDLGAPTAPADVSEESGPSDVVPSSRPVH